MSEENSSTPEPPSSTPATGAPRVRRISTPRPKKVAKKAVPADEQAEPAPVSAPAPVVAPSAPAPAPDVSSAGDQDWPEPEAASNGSASASEGAKRKRRRRKGKGQSNGQGAPASGEAPPSAGPSTFDDEDAGPPAPRPQQPPQQQPQMQVKPQGPPPAPQRPRIDPELLTKMAWKIYLAEIGEEGVALIGDNDAKELSRRCFRLAEIFIEEQSRRR